MTAEHERQAELLLHPIDEAEGVLDVADVVDEDGELVAAEPRHGVADADAAFKPAGDPHQQFVAGHVAETVIDDLEAVEVEEENGELEPVRPLGARDRAAEPIREQGAVGQAGEDVVVRLMDKLLLGGLALGDVLVGDDDADRVEVAEAGHSDVEPAAALGGMTGVLTRVFVAPMRDDLADAGGDGRRLRAPRLRSPFAGVEVIHPHAAGPRERVHVFPLLPRGVHREDRASGVEDRDPGGEGVERCLQKEVEAAQVLLFLAEHLLPKPVSLRLRDLLLPRQRALILAVSGLDEIVEGRTEVIEDLLFRRGDPQRVTHEQHVVAIRRRGVARRLVREDGADPREQGVGLKRLVDIIVGAALQPARQIKRLRQAGEENERGLHAPRMRLDLATKFIPGQSRHHHVAKDQIKFRRSERLPAGAPVGRGRDDEIGGLQDGLKPPGLRRAVLDDEHANGATFAHVWSLRGCGREPLSSPVSLVPQPGLVAPSARNSGRWSSRRGDQVEIERPDG